MAEDFGIQGRGAFYDGTGAVRDVVQNHLFQVLSNLAMEPPVRSDSESIRDEKVKVLKAIPALTANDVVRGQFRGYRSEKGVAPDSTVETFVALRLQIDSWRWQGVPFYIRAGKCLPVTCTEVVVRLRQPPTMFHGFDLEPNYCRFRISPDVTIAIGANVIAPGQETRSQTAEMLGTRLPRADEMDAYERVLGDAMQGDATLFAREDYVEEAWRIVDPVLKAGTPVYEYEPGTWGPKELDAGVSPPGGWQNPTVQTAMKIEALADADAVARAGAAFTAEEARAAVAARGRFIMAVSGGHTPWQMLRALADEHIPWAGVHVVQVDERVAPAGHPDRNLTHLRESLLAHCPLRPEQVHAMPVESADLESASRPVRRDAPADCRRSGCARSRAPGPRARRPHRIAGARGSGARRDRRRRCAHGALSRSAPDDLDLSRAQSVPAYCLARHRRRKGADAGAPV